MKAKRWPNGLGWDVGKSEVRDCVTHLRCFVPCGGEYRRADFPIGTDPVKCVLQTRRTGTRFDYYGSEIGGQRP